MKGALKAICESTGRQWINSELNHLMKHQTLVERCFCHMEEYFKIWSSAFRLAYLEFFFFFHSELCIYITRSLFVSFFTSFTIASPEWLPLAPLILQLKKLRPKEIKLLAKFIQLSGYTGIWNQDLWPQPVLKINIPQKGERCIPFSLEETGQLFVRKYDKS